MHPGDERLNRMRALARWLDAQYKIGPVAIGWDAIIGLVPGIGDSISSLLGGYILVQAANAGIPGPIIFRMAFNLALETFLGAVPFLGDVFDVLWKANIRNVALYEAAISNVKQTERRSLVWLTLWFLGILVLVGLLIAVPILVIAWLLR
jgi:hypothetical protein